MRSVFQRALRDMLVLVAVLAVVGVGVGALVVGTPGVWGALLGVAVALLFSGTTVVSMIVTVGRPAATTAGVILGSWLVKMIVLVVILVLLQGREFYDRTTFVVVLLAGVLGSLVLDYRAVAAGRVPYVDPDARRDAGRDADPDADPGAARKL